jgi:hypothetical protein
MLSIIITIKRKDNAEQSMSSTENIQIRKLNCAVIPDSKTMLQTEIKMFPEITWINIKDSG